MPTVEVDIKQLLEAGAHFGHKTERWHPKMAPYIHSKRGGSHIIDLTKTVEGLNEALDFISKTASEGKQILFVGTKRQAQDVVKKVAEEAGMPFVTERWLGGMLTNWSTIGSRVKRLQDLENRMASGELANKYNKLEVQRFQEEIDELNRLYGGIKELHAKPGAVFIVDIVHESNALKEARKLGIPTIALVDTNADPSLVTYAIPSNDDAIKTIQLMADYAKQAIEQGKAKVKIAPTPDKDEKGEQVMAVSIEEIKRLRELTGVGMTDAKRALEDSKGDFDKALAEMRKKGFTKAEKRAEREARAGLIGTYNHDSRIGVLVEVNCETDFVARNEIFVNLVKDITMHIAASNPQFVSTNDVSDDVKKIARNEFVEKAKAENKPADMIDKIVDGQLQKYFAERCLLDQPFVKNPDITVGDYVKEHNARLGENIVVRRFSRMALGEVV